MSETKIPVWTKEERKKLIEANMPSVLKVAERYKKEGEYKDKIPMSVLEEEGKKALIEYIDENRCIYPNIEEFIQYFITDAAPFTQRLSELNPDEKVRFCLEAVKQDGLALKYVPENLKTAKLCLAAVKSEGCALSDVPKNLKTPRLCREAVKQNGGALEYVPEKLKTMKLCLDAIGRKCVSDDPIDKKYHEIDDTLSNMCSPFPWVPIKLLTAKFYFEAVKRNSQTLNWVRPGLMSLELCIEAVKHFSKALEFVPEALKEEVKNAVGC